MQISNEYLEIRIKTGLEEKSRFPRCIVHVLFFLFTWFKTRWIFDHAWSKYMPPPSAWSITYKYESLFEITTIIVLTPNNQICMTTSAVGESRVPGSRPNASSHGRKKLMLDTRKKEDVVKLCKWITNTIYITVDQSCKIVQRLTDDHKIVFYAHKHGLNLRLKP